MRGSLIVTALFLAASALSAQNKSTVTLTAPGQPTTTFVITPFGRCPIAFSGDLKSPSSTELLTKGTSAQYSQPDDTANRRQHLQLSFDGTTASSKLLKVHVTVYGSPKGPHVMLVNSDTDNTVSEDFDLTTQAKVAATAFRSNVYPMTMGVPQWAEITQIDYADGSAWHPSSTSTCKVALTGFKLVNSVR